jgi:hypothetical protein
LIKTVTSGSQFIRKGFRNNEIKLTYKGQSEINPKERGYNELRDEFSLHQLIFRKGKLIDQTPEFVKSFRRTYIDKWGPAYPVSFILMNFEKLFTDHNV